MSPLKAVAKSCKDPIQKERGERDEMKGKELRRDVITQTAVAIGCNEQFAKEAAMR